jgi:uncharacterized protein YeaO (DUF488 family)
MPRILKSKEPTTMLKIKRAYESPAKADGFRVLVERLWPRGVTKDRAALDAWLKDIAPSPELRTWFAHDPEKWQAFRRRYWSELKSHPDALNLLQRKSREGPVTLVSGARDERHNAAVALRDYLKSIPSSLGRVPGGGEGKGRAAREGRAIVSRE